MEEWGRLSGWWQSKWSNAFKSKSGTIQLGTQRVWSRTRHNWCILAWALHSLTAISSCLAYLYPCWGPYSRCPYVETWLGSKSSLLPLPWSFLALSSEVLAPWLVPGYPSHNREMEEVSLVIPDLISGTRMECWLNKWRLEDLLSQNRAAKSMFKAAEKDETEVLVRALTNGRKTFTSTT